MAMGKALVLIFLVTGVILFKLVYVGNISNRLVEQGAPEDALVYFEDTKSDVYFAVYSDRVELYGDGVRGSNDTVISISEIKDVRVIGATLILNTVRGQISVAIVGLSSGRVRKAADQIRDLIEPLG
jgi:hypothetical protein